ncbi:MAG: ImmA/IrrE family metallo-endopeptidase [Clostridia bacterium]|nr:ImmA/IrrE family metallo-endopeptidase [Clostridia bacterium]
MNSRQQLARQLVAAHYINDPRQLIELLHIPHIETPLPASIHGFTCAVSGQVGTVVNSQLDESQLSYARAHELGHALLHDHVGHYPIVESTFIPSGRYERQADEFAQALLDAQTSGEPVDR